MSPDEEVSSEIPLLIVGFNRPHLISQLITAIRQEKPRVVFFAQDGARTGNETDQRLCEETRVTINEIDWECSLYTLISSENMGTKQRLTSAVDRVLRDFKSVIILEDDCIPTKGFLGWATQMSRHLENNSKIGMLSGNRFDFTGATCTLSRFPRTWGWVTNRENWNGFKPDQRLEIEKVKTAIAQNVKNPFARRHWYARYSIAISDKHMWDVQWTIHLWTKNKKTLVPPVNLVSNLGGGEDATHTMNPSIFLDWPTPDRIDPEEYQFQRVTETVRHGIEPLLLRIEAIIGIINRIGASRLSAGMAVFIRRGIAHIQA